MDKRKGWIQEYSHILFENHRVMQQQKKIYEVVATNASHKTRDKQNIIWKNKNKWKKNVFKTSIYINV